MIKICDLLLTKVNSNDIIYTEEQDRACSVYFFVEQM